MQGFEQSIVDAPGWVVLLLKITAILVAAWLVHLALRGANPRWRVLLWRVTVVGLIALPTVAWLLPAIKIYVGQAAAVTETVDIPVPAPVLAVNRDIATPAQGGFAVDISDGPPLHQLPMRPDEVGVPHPQANVPAPEKPLLITASRVLLAVWLVGVGVLACRFCVGYYRMWRMAHGGKQPSQWVRSECLRVAQAIGCRGRVEVLESTAVQSPLLCGLRCQRLLLPASLCEDAYRTDLPAILAHELAHVRSRDVLWNFGLHLISVVLWFHPFAWRMRRAHLAACELVSDAVSVSFVGDVTEYCRTLARVAVQSYASIPATGIAMARSSSISRRLGALKRKIFSLPLRRRSAIGFGFAALLTVAALGVLQFALAAPPPAEPVAAGKAETKTVEKEAKLAIDPNATPKTASLRVRVVDEAGKPLAATKLAVKFLGHEKNYTTDVEGKATVAAPGPNRLFLSMIAYPEGYPPVRKWWRNDSGNELIPDEFTFTFERGRTIGGFVRNEQGEPIQGAKVHLNIPLENYQQVGMGLALWDSVFLTDAEGRWHLDHFPRKIESIYLGLEHPDYISVTGPAEISAAEQRQVLGGIAVMVMKRGIPVTGTVTDPEGKPVAGATVLLGEWNGPKQPAVSTDEKGHYRFASLAPGGAVLTATRPGLSPALCSINVEPQMKPVDFSLEKGNTLRVRVVDKDGKPIHGIFVTPDTWRGRRVLCDVGVKGRTDAEGRWAWTWAPEDAVQTSFGLTGYVNYMSIYGLPLATQQTEHVVTLYPCLQSPGG